MGRKPFTLIAAIIFAVMAVLHAFRLYSGFTIVLGSHDIPVWASWIGLVVAGVLCIGLFRESQR
jgi:hypothetical protein